MSGLDTEWKTVTQTLADEYRALRPGWSKDVDALPEAPGAPHEPARLKGLYAKAAELQAANGGAERLSALCLSGGGIRSATFNLGVLQALARAGLLSRFDYLSTVSGGGYVGAWLQAWIHRKREGRTRVEAVVDVERELAASGGAGVADPLNPEPKPVDRLREFSNYLTPRKGLLSGDTWAVVAIVVRNLLLNWLVTLPALSAVVLLPQLAALVAAHPALVARVADPGALAWAALATAAASSFATHWLRAHRRGPAASGSEEERNRRRTLRGLATFGTLGLFVLAALLFLGLALAAGDPLRAMPILPVRSPAPAPFAERIVAAALWTIGIPVFGVVTGWAAWLLQGGARDDAGRGGRAFLWARVADLVALGVSGGVAAVGLAWLTAGPWRALTGHPAATAIFALPALLALYALARVLFTAVSTAARGVGLGRDSGDDADREWWARVTGRVLAVGLVWLAGSALSLLGALLLERATRDGWRELLGKSGITGTAALGALSSTVVALLGRGEGTSSGRGAHSGSSPVKELALRVAAPLAAGATLVLLAVGTAAAARWVSPGAAPEERLAALARHVAYFALASFAAGFLVDVNRFSLHGMYRNRLVRAYLGASNVDRRPNAVSGFDPEDGELRLAKLAPENGEPGRLFPIVNVTLNLIRGERLAWQERQAESFSMTPLHCGNFYEGYRPTAAYGSRHGGVTLGTAMAVSGAAASPNMGYVSSPALTFLLALLNARLGVWLANPNAHGEKVVSSPGPRHATWHLLRELLGATSRYASYVNLSDGGHFENLGLYQVVLRRCRLVVVSDAACDPAFGFGDLGNAIRKIRIDFGIPIRFDRGIEILPRDKDGTPPRGAGLYCAVGTIDYAAADGVGAPRGEIVYLKPTLARGPTHPIPHDVLAYALGSAPFPHESTADQWFSEAQFESYRALGLHLVEELLAGGGSPLPPQRTVADLVAAAQAHVAAVAGAAPPPAQAVPQGGAPRSAAAAQDEEARRDVG